MSEIWIVAAGTSNKTSSFNESKIDKIIDIAAREMPTIRLWLSKDQLIKKLGS